MDWKRAGKKTKEKKKEIAIIIKKLKFIFSRAGSSRNTRSEFFFHFDLHAKHVERERERERDSISSDVVRTFKYLSCSRVNIRRTEQRRIGHREYGNWPPTMRIIWHAFLLHLCAFGARCAPERTTLPITISTSGAAEDRGRGPGEDEEPAKKEVEEEEKEIEAVPMTEQVMNPNIKITDVPDVDEASEEWDADWDKNKVIRDVAYYIRAHKFRDYDRRYYKRLEDSPSRLYEEFPKPPLRSLHWEVRR